MEPDGSEITGADGEIYEINRATREALQKANAEVVGSPKRRLGELDMMVVRVPRVNRSQERSAVSGLHKAIQKANRGWKGLLLVLPMGFNLDQLPATSVERIYESLLMRFDPDLYSMRMARKANATQARDIVLLDNDPAEAVE